MVDQFAFLLLLYDLVFTGTEVFFVLSVLIAGSARLNRTCGERILLYCLQSSLDSTVLIWIFARFILWWIFLDIFVVDTLNRSLNAMQAPWLINLWQNDARPI